jgi:hypothetical protein
MRHTPPEVHRARLDRFVGSGWRAVGWVGVILAGGVLMRALGVA